MLVIFIIVVFIMGAFIIEKNHTIESQYKKIRNLEKKVEELEEKVTNCSIESKEKNDNAVLSKIVEPKTNDFIEDEIIADELKESNSVITPKSEEIPKNITNNSRVKVSNIDKRNSNILVTGSVLIVLAAIVFLTSTWHTIPNLFKTFVLVLFIGLFLGLSKVAKEKFNLKKTSKTFFYIAMAYIPICLIGISIFGLFGEYLSIRGEGRSLYLFLIFIILSTLYYSIYKKSGSKGLLLSSLISQCSAVVAFATILDVNFSWMCVLLLLYTMLLILVGKDEFVLLIQKGIVCIVATLFVLYNYSVIQDKTSEFLDVAVYFLITINFFMLYIKNKNDLFFGLFNGSALLFGKCLFTCNILTLGDHSQLLLNIIWVMVLYSLVNLWVKDKEKLRINTIITLVVTNYLCIVDKNNVLKWYIYGILDSIVLTILFIKKLFNDDIINWVLPECYIITIELIPYSYNLNEMFYFLIAILVWFVFLIKRGKEIFDNGFILSHVAIIISIGIIMSVSSIGLTPIMIFAILMIIYLISYIKTNHFIFKYLTYISFIPLYYSIGKYFRNFQIGYMCLILSLIVLLIENIYSKKIKDNYSDIFVLVVCGLAFLGLGISPQLQYVIWAIILSILIITIKVYKNKDISYNILPLIGGAFVIIRYNNLYLDLILGIVLTLLSLTKIDKKHEFTVASIAYLGIFALGFNNNIVSYIILFIWSLLNSNIIKEKKNIFILLTYIFAYMIYREILIKFDIDNYVFTKFFGLQVLGLLIFRLNLNNKLKIDINSFKDIVYVLVYLWAIFNFNNIEDGMISVAIMIVSVFIHYPLKENSIVLINLIAIIISAFGLTKEFWLSIPWWIYLLVIGFILIGFAVINEAREEDKKINYESFKKKMREFLKK